MQIMLCHPSDRLHVMRRLDTEVWCSGRPRGVAFDSIALIE